MEREARGGRHLPVHEEEIGVVPRAPVERAEGRRGTRWELEVLDNAIARLAGTVLQEDLEDRVLEDRPADGRLDEVAQVLRHHPHRHVELSHLAVAAGEELLGHGIGAQIFVSLVYLDERALSPRARAIPDRLHDGRHRKFLGERILADAGHVEGEQVMVEAELGLAVQELRVKAIAVDRETARDPLSNLLVLLSGAVGAERVAEIRDQGAAAGLLAQALVDDLDGARHHVGGHHVETRRAGIADAQVEKIDDELDFLALESPRVAQHAVERGKRRNGGPRVERDIDAAHQLGHGLPAFPVVDEDAVNARCERVEREKAEADGLPRARVGRDQAMKRVAELRIEEIELEGIASRREQNARRAAATAPGGEDRQQIAGVAGSATLLS